MDSHLLYLDTITTETLPLLNLMQYTPFDKYATWTRTLKGGILCFPSCLTNSTNNQSTLQAGESPFKHMKRLFKQVKLVQTGQGTIETGKTIYNQLKQY